MRLTRLGVSCVEKGWETLLYNTWLSILNNASDYYILCWKIIYNFIHIWTTPLHYLIASSISLLRVCRLHVYIPRRNSQCYSLVCRHYRVWMPFRAEFLNVKDRGTWWRFGWVDDFQPDDRGFDSRSYRHVGTLGRSYMYTYSCLCASAWNSDTVSVL